MSDISPGSLRHLLLLGDSTTAMQGTADIGGCDIVLAGIPGARIRELADLAPYLARILRPKVWHIMAGTNNVPLLADDPERLSELDDYRRIVTAARAYNDAKCVLWKILPNDASLAETHPAARREELWSIALAVQAEFGGDSAGVYDDYLSNNLTGPDGYALPGVTIDGIHPSVSTMAWRADGIGRRWRDYFAGIGWGCQ